MVQVQTAGPKTGKEPMRGLRAAAAATAPSERDLDRQKCSKKKKKTSSLKKKKLSKTKQKNSQVLEAAAEAGADDAVPTSNRRRWRVLTAVDQFGAVRDALVAAGLPVAADASGLEWIPKTPVELEGGEEDVLDANEKLYQKLLEVTDVDAVFCNCPDVGVDDDDEE